MQLLLIQSRKCLTCFVQHDLSVFYRWICFTLYFVLLLHYCATWKNPQPNQCHLLTTKRKPQTSNPRLLSDVCGDQCSLTLLGDGSDTTQDAPPLCRPGLKLRWLQSWAWKWYFYMFLFAIICIEKGEKKPADWSNSSGLVLCHLILFNPSVSIKFCVLPSKPLGLVALAVSVTWERR